MATHQVSPTCPALLIAAPGSGQGKTTITAALARYHRDQGRTVRVFKMGPDFLDPMILEQASGHPVDPLHLWMVGEEECRAMLHAAAREADLILVEGSMGLFDGDPSAADLAVRFGLPVLGIIDASGMAETFGAVANGLATWRPDLPFAGVMANRVGSAGHGRMLGQALPAGIRYFGALPRSESMEIPDRHLGLVQPEEIEDLEQCLEAAATAVSEAGVTGLPEPVAFPPGSKPKPEPELAGVRIAIARDPAFAFIYPANLRLLEEMGAEVIFFLPLSGDGLPEADAVWLPGGYPELFLDILSANEALKADLHAYHRAGVPILAECGGLLYLLTTLADAEGHRAVMAGLLRGEAWLEERVQGIGLQAAPLPEGEIRGHTFHHSRAKVNLEPLTHCVRARDRGSVAEAVYRDGRLTATYLHAWFPSNPGAVASLFRP